MTRYVENLRVKLDEAMLNMEKFIGDITNTVMLNAGIVKHEYEDTGLKIDKALTDPWLNAMAKVAEFAGEKGLGMMNAWTQEGGAFGVFSTDASELITSPFKAGESAMKEFEKTIRSQMVSAYSSVNSNVEQMVTELDKLKEKYKEINDEASRPPATGDDDPAPAPAPKKTQYRATATLMIGNTGLFATGTGETEAKARSAAQIAIAGQYEKLQKEKGIKQEKYESSWLKTYRRQVKYEISQYAKGTTGTDRDQWALTDEPQFGDELVLVPGKDGNLSFMRKGTGVVPADMTQKLFELAQIPTSDLMRKNITAIVPDIQKTDISNTFSFDSLVHVDHCDQSTLKDLEKMVDNKINQFGKQMNYAVKKFTR